MKEKHSQLALLCQLDLSIMFSFSYQQAKTSPHSALLPLLLEESYSPNAFNKRLKNRRMAPESKVFCYCAGL